MENIEIKQGKGYSLLIGEFNHSIIGIITIAIYYDNETCFEVYNNNETILETINKDDFITFCNKYGFNPDFENIKDTLNYSICFDNPIGLKVLDVNNRTFKIESINGNKVNLINVKSEQCVKLVNELKIKNK